jgi:N-acetylneuraminate synthase
MSPAFQPSAVRIGKRLVGPGHPCLIIAEAGVNHNGDVELAHRLIDEAKAAGADVVKFQAFRTDELVTPSSMKAQYQAETTGAGGSQSDMLRALELSPQEHAGLKRHCDEADINYMCTPYDEASVDLLDELDVEAFKVASTDATNIPLLRYIATKGRPVILSSGMTTIDELDQAVEALVTHGVEDKLIVLHCTAAYPAPKDESNLRVLSSIQQRYELPAGFSDHTQGIDVPVLAVAAGACVLEKHFTLDRGAVGPDHRASLEPDDLRRLVEHVRDAERVLGDGVKVISEAEMVNKAVLQKGLVARRMIRAGQVIELSDVTSKRPATGLPPGAIDWVVGSVAVSDIGADTPITSDLLRKPSNGDLS